MGLFLTAVEPTAQIMKQKRLLSKQPYNWSTNDLNSQKVIQQMSSFSATQNLHLKPSKIHHTKIKKTSKIALGISNQIAAHVVHVTLQWIPGHCNINGNEKADKLAKIGATKPQKNPPCTQNTIKQILKKTMRRRIG